MATSNPFDELSVFLPPLVVQVFIVLMIIAVVVERSSAGCIRAAL